VYGPEIYANQTPAPPFPNKKKIKKIKKINVTSNVCIREHELNPQSAKGQSPYAFERYSIALHFLESKFWFGLERICPGIFKLLLKQFPQNQSSYDEWTDISKTYFRKKNCPWGTVLLVT